MTQKVVHLGTELRWWWPWYEFSCREYISYPTTWTVLAKSFLGVSSPIHSKWGLTHCRSDQEVSITEACWTPPGHTLCGIRNFREVWAQAAFFCLKRGSFQICSTVVKVFCRYKCNKEWEKNTFHRFQSVKAKRGQPFTDCTIFGHMGAILSPWQRWRRGVSPPALP